VKDAVSEESGAEEASGVELKSIVDSASYSIGVNIANNLVRQGMLDMDSEVIAAAMKDVFDSVELAMPLTTCNTYIGTYMEKKELEKHQGTIDAGKAFLMENAKNDSVVVLPSGLQYKVITAGEGAIPKATDEVTTYYKGMLVDGTVFDSSKGNPVSFPVNRVIEGWIEALQLMPVGSKWKLYIPYDLAYGAQQKGAVIVPYSALIFEIELLGIK
jgi:FKBP-type peptidyl-prolyl cis-trans isomerase FklB